VEQGQYWGKWDLAMGLLPDVGFIGEKWVHRLTKIKAVVSYAACAEVVHRAPLLLTLVLAMLASLPSGAGMKP
jgi:hypothetical protein